MYRRDLRGFYNRPFHIDRLQPNNPPDHSAHPPPAPFKIDGMVYSVFVTPRFLSTPMFDGVAGW